MNVTTVTGDYNEFINGTDDKDEDYDNIIKYLLLSIPSSILLICPVSLIKRTIFKALVTIKW